MELIKKYKTNENNNKKKGLLIFTFSLAAIVPIAFLAYFGHRNVDSIGFEGSSTVKPLVDAFAKNYLKTNNKVDINVQAGGSSAGLAKVINGQTDFGNYSEETKPAATSDKYKNIWIDRQLKTITLAWDGIGVVYKPSSSCQENVVFNKDNIKYLYAAFAGNKINASDKYTLATFMADHPSSCDVPVLPYARTGGADKSGTAAAFLKSNGIFDYKKATKDKDLANVIKPLINGQYNKEGHVTSTGEANSIAWSNIASDKKDGSMIYLSIGFIIKNWDTIKEAGYKVAEYQVGDKITAINPDNYQIEIGKSYLWYRPLNTITSIINLSEEKKKLIEWMLNSKQEHIISDLGFIPLSKEQLARMGYSENDPNAMWKSDNELKTYGASEH